MYSQPPPATTRAADAAHVSRLGEQIYESKRAELEKTHPGKYITIEAESQDMFIGDSLREAAQKAREKYPSKIFYTVKVGQPTVYSFSSPSSGASIVGTPSLL